MSLAEVINVAGLWLCPGESPALFRIDEEGKIEYDGKPAQGKAFLYFDEEDQTDDLSLSLKRKSQEKSKKPYLLRRISTSSFRDVNSMHILTWKTDVEPSMKKPRIMDRRTINVDGFLLQWSFAWCQPR